MSNIKKVSGYMPIPARFRHLDEQRRNINRDTAPLDVVEYTASALVEVFPLSSILKNKYIRWTAVAGPGCTIQIPLDMPWLIGDEVKIMNVTAARPKFEALPGVTINSFPDPATLLRPFHQATLKKVGPNEYDLYGDLS